MSNSGLVERIQEDASQWEQENDPTATKIIVSESFYNIADSEGVTQDSGLFQNDEGRVMEEIAGFVVHIDEGLDVAYTFEGGEPTERS